jgi:hypothetical protein
MALPTGAGMSDVADWFYARGGQQQGPVTLDGLRAMAATGQLAAGDLVWRNGTADWKPAGEVPEIFVGGTPVPSAASVEPAPAAAFSPGFPTEGTPTVAPSGQAVYGGPSMDPGWSNNADASEREIPIPSYLLQAILCTLFCFLPLGIVAIIHAAMVGSKINGGDFEGARAASDKAKMWCKLSFWIGLAVGTVYLVGVFSGALGGRGGGRISHVPFE